jgi:protoporphyrinogen oxidase
MHVTIERVRYLVVGAGVSGLTFAARAGGDYLVIEMDEEVGGYCKTVQQDGFTWDYSGHFFHFKHPEIEAELVSKMAGQRVLKVERDSRILWGRSTIDFPFQKNIHQLPREDFLDCLHDLFFKEDREATNFEEMLYAKFGRSIAEKFLIPYNEKLYATKLSTLDVDAMGRFFPYADVADIIRNFRRSDNSSYNATFTYPAGGAIQYIEAILTDVDKERIALSERLEAVDLSAKVARTSRREIAFEYLVSSAPLPRLLEISSLPHDPSVFSWNKVLVFNLGFDRKGPTGVHWMYIPQRELCFYRLGFYDNIFGDDRMSMYVELGRPRDVVIDAAAIETAREEVLRDLVACGVVEDHQLVSSHAVVLDPAYVHITKASVASVERCKRLLAARGVYSVGRYGSWTYCSIEDNMVEARALADDLRAVF